MPNGDRALLQKAADASDAVTTPGSYAYNISWVNFAMNRFGVGLTRRQESSIRQNMNEVDSGNMTNAEASWSEGRGFLRDSMNPSLPPRDRLGAGVGAFANLVFGAAFHSSTDVHNLNKGINQSKGTRVAMHSFVSGDLG